MSRHALIGLLALALAVLMPSTASAASGDFQPRVVGGSSASIAEYPWQAAVVFDHDKVAGNAFQRQFCGGSLVTTYIVITAAHCVYDTDPDCSNVVDCLVNDPTGDGTPALDADDVEVVMGRTVLSSADGIQHEVQGTDWQSDYNPNYNPPPAGVPSSDVGYLVLAAPGSAQPTIDIAGTGEEAVWAPGIFAEVSGWGATAESGPGSGGSDSLLAASVPIVSDSSCATDYGSSFNPATMVCAGYPQGGIDTCFGDSGGPLESPLEGGGYRLVGLTSWGSGCAQPNAPGVYTRIADPTLRAAVEARVDQFETDLTLPDEPIVGSGGTPSTGPPKYPAPPPVPPSVAQPSATTAAPIDPFAKCRKVRSKKKRKKCTKKVKATLRS